MTNTKPQRAPGQWQDPDEFMEVYSRSQVKKELQEYIASEISVQVEEHLARLFGPAQDREKTKQDAKRRCLICGAPIKQQGRGRIKYCALRDLSTIQWYILPLFGLVIYIYAKEIKKSRETANWLPILAALTLFGCDFFNETWNGWVFHLSNRSAVWTTPGPTALRVMVGWNIEIILTFALFGLVFYHSLLPDRDRKILGIPNQWFMAILFAVFAVFIEVVLNIGGQLVWEYPWWNRSFAGIWIIFFVGYFYWFVAIIIMLNMKNMKKRLVFVGAIYAVPIIMSIIGLGILGWRY